MRAMAVVVVVAFAVVDADAVNENAASFHVPSVRQLQHLVTRLLLLVVVMLMLYAFTFICTTQSPGIKN